MQPDFDAFDDLLAAVCDGRASPEETARLSALLAASAELRDRYLHHMDLHAQLASDPTLFADAAVVAPAPQSPQLVERASASRWRSLAKAIHPRRHPLAFAATVLLLTLGYWLAVQAAFLHFGYSSSDEPIVATTPTPTIDVALLTGTHEVQWHAQQTPYHRGERLLAGSELRWAKGFVEVTYDTGVRVVVEGPARLQIDSPSSGRLAEGKLVAFVPPQGRGFALELPAARVIDLGTEFGVVAQRSGVADLTVYQGTVKVSPPRGTKHTWKSQRLVAGQSLRLEQSGPLVDHALAASDFALVRALPSSDLSLDIVDIVAGGSGLGRASNAGLDFRSGARVDRFSEGIAAADGAFHVVAVSQFIDGVFVIRGDAQPQPISSRGEDKFLFPHGAGQSWGQLWAWEPRVDEPGSHTWIYTYPHNAGRLLAMHANAGMTLDLDKVRSAYPDHRLRRLQGYVLDEFVPQRGHRGNRTAAWVIVDGAARVAELPLVSGDKPARIDVPFNDTDRFITLAATDGGDGLTCDFVIWKHLRLLLETTSPAKVQATTPAEPANP